MSNTPFSTPISRLYIDTRPLLPAPHYPPPPTPNPAIPSLALPLLHTLPTTTQESIIRYLRPADKLMSLASALLKHYFIHRTAHIPWSEVTISRTAAPHRRPYWHPSFSSRESTRNGVVGDADRADIDGIDGAGAIDGGLEFNVTHQASLVGLVGCRTPTGQDPAYNTSPSSKQVRLGVDVACVHEKGRGTEKIKGQRELEEWLGIFGEMFSQECLEGIRTAEITGGDGKVEGEGGGGEGEVVQGRLRRFYAFWALKEAYIKMVGEGLLADWLRKLEFEGVDVPGGGGKEERVDDGFSWALRDEEAEKWTSREKMVRGIKALMEGKWQAGVKMELAGYEEEFLWVVAMKGLEDSGDGRWVKLDIERDVRPCAEGRCRCLEKR